MKTRILIAGIVLIGAGSLADFVQAGNAQPAAEPTPATLRKPKDMAEGLKGEWTGLWAITEASATAKGQKPVEAAMAVTFDPAKWEKPTGTMANFKIEGGIMPRYNPGNRSIEFDLMYKLNTGYWVKFKGTVAEDWNSISGDFTFILGKGKFKILFGPGHQYKPKSAEWKDVQEFLKGAKK